MIEMSLQHDEPVTMPARSFGQRARSMAAHAAVVAVMLVSPLVVFVPAALLHCGIRNGRRAAWVLLGIAALIGAILITPAALTAHTADAAAAAAYFLRVLLATGIPALAILPLLERGESLGRLLLVALLIGLAGLAATELIVRGTTGISPYAGHVADTRQAAELYRQAYQKAGLPADVINVVAAACTYCIAAMLAGDIAVTFVLSLVMLGRLRAWRELAAARGGALLAPLFFRALVLPEWLLFVFVISGLSPLATGLLRQIGINVLVAVVFLYLLQGMAVVRFYAAAAGRRFIGSLLVWAVVALLVMMGVGLLLLILTGLFDSFFDFRHFNRKDSSDESHSH